MASSASCICEAASREGMPVRCPRSEKVPAELVCRNRGKAGGLTATVIVF
jgi:hypothetical protein